MARRSARVVGLSKRLLSTGRTHRLGGRNRRERRQGGTVDRCPVPTFQQVCEKAGRASASRRIQGRRPPRHHLAVFLLIARSCGSSDFRTSLSLALDAAPLTGPVTNDRGITLELKRAQLSLRSLGVVDCADTPVPFNVRRLLLLTRSVARAHVPPEHEARTEEVLDALSLSRKAWRNIRPAPDAYCQVQADVAPATRDYAEAVATEMIGKTFLVEGRWTSNKVDWQEFLIASDLRLRVFADLVDQTGEQQPLELRGTPDEVTVHVRLDPNRWVEGLEPGMSDDDLETQAARNILASFQHSTSVTP